ncbi:hypothetical protein, partial [Cohnella kolymensis]|uniref:hypothetical protein n=1 Tax=Cohnella kolymensis TaxID=1590652 RepID=UPI001F3DD8C9
LSCRLLPCSFNTCRIYVLYSGGGKWGYRCSRGYMYFTQVAENGDIVVQGDICNFTQVAKKWEVYSAPDGRRREKDASPAGGAS